MSNLQNKRLVLWPKSSSLLVYIGSSEQDAETCTLGGFTWTPILKFAKCYRDTFHLAYFHFWPSFFFKRFWNDKSPLLLINRIPHPLSSECRPVFDPCVGISVVINKQPVCKCSCFESQIASLCKCSCFASLLVNVCRCLSIESRLDNLCRSWLANLCKCTSM